MPGAGSFRFDACSGVGVPVSVVDASGTEVVRAVITMHVTPKK